MANAIRNFQILRAVEEIQVILETLDLVRLEIKEHLHDLLDQVQAPMVEGQALIEEDQVLLGEVHQVVCDLAEEEVLVVQEVLVVAHPADVVVVVLSL